MRFFRPPFVRFIAGLIVIASLLSTPAYAVNSEDSQIFISGFNAYQKKDYPGAVEKMKSVLDKYPDSPLRDMAIFWLARSSFKAGNQQEAAKYMAQFFKEYPDSPLKGTVEDELLVLVSRYEKGEKLPAVAVAQSIDKVAAEKAAREKAEAERAASARIAAEKAEREQVAAEKAERARAEAERLAAEKLAAERAAAGKAAAEKLAREKAEVERVAQAKAAAEKAANEKAVAEQAAKAKAEAERVALAKAAAEKVAAEKAAAEKLAAEQAAKAKAEAERIALAKAAAERAAAERAAAEKAAAEKLAREKAEAERIAMAKAAAEKAAAEKLAAEQAAKAKAEAEQAALAKAAAEKLAREKAEAERIAMAKAAAEKAAAEKLAAEQAAKAKAEAEQAALAKAEAEKLAREKAEAERTALAKAAAEKAAAEKAKADQLAAAKAAEKLAAEQAVKAKAEAERIALAKVAAEKAAAEQMAKAKAEAERLAAERLAAEKTAAERLAAEQAARAKAEAERIAVAKLAAEKAERERLAAEKATREKAEAERVAAERAAAERIAAEKAERERLAAVRAAEEKAAADRIAVERVAAEKLAAERAAAERLAAEKAAKEKLAAERFAVEKAAAEKAAAERAAVEKVARAKAEAERIAADKVAAGKAAAERQAAEMAAAERTVEAQARSARAAALKEKAIAEYKSLIARFPGSRAAETAAAKLQELGVTAPVAVASPVVPAAAVIPAVVARSNSQILNLEVGQYADLDFSVQVAGQGYEAGKRHEIPFEIVNRGNGSDSFTLESGFPAEFNVQFAAQGKNGIQLASTPMLEPGEKFRGIVSFMVPRDFIDGQKITHSLLVASQHTRDVSQSREVYFVASAPLLRAVVKSDKGMILPGEKVTYRVALLNIGTTSAQGVSLRLNYPPQYEPVGFAESGFKQEMKSALVVDGLKINSGESREFQVTFQLKDDAIAQQELFCRADVINNELQTRDSFLSTASFVQAVSGVAVRAAADKLVVIPGQTVALPLIVTNTGNVREDFLIKSSSPGKLSYTFYQDLNRDGIRQVSEPIINHVGPLAPKEEAYVILELATPATESDGSAVDFAVAFEPESLRASSAKTTLRLAYSRPVVSLAMAGKGGRLRPGEISSFDLNFTNSGSNMAKQVELQSVMPGELELVASEPSYTQNRNGEYFWKFDEIGAGEKRSIKVTYRVKSGVSVGTNIQVKNLLKYQDQLGNRY